MNQQGQVELGLRMCVMAEADGLILHHRVMERCTDDAVAVPMVQETRDRFPLLRAVSMEKGFHRPSNQTELRQIVGTVVLPKKRNIQHLGALLRPQERDAEKRRRGPYRKAA